MSFDRAFLVFAAGVTAAIHVGKLPPALPLRGPCPRRCPRRCLRLCL
jgi:hypothetical protein